MPPLIAFVLAAAWFVALLFQLGDLTAQRLDLVDAREAVPARRGPAIFWGVPLGSLLLVGILFGLDRGVRVAIEEGDVVRGSLLALALASLAAGGASVGAVFVRRRMPSEFAVLLAEVRARRGSRITAAELAELHSRYARLETWHAPPRDRSPRPLAALATRRGIPTYLGLAALVAIVVAVTTGGLEPAYLLVGVLMPVVSSVLAVLARRASIEAARTWHRVHETQRVEIARIIAELDRRAAKGVAGLSDRVSRALQILREQQG